MKKAPELNRLPSMARSRKPLQAARVTRNVGTLDFIAIKKGTIVRGFLTTYGDFQVTRGTRDQRLWCIREGYFELL